MDGNFASKAEGRNATVEEGARGVASRLVFLCKMVLIFTLILNWLATANHNTS